MEQKQSNLIEEKSDQTIEKLSKEEVDAIISGKRPNGMDFEKYKILRKFMKNTIKNYLKGGLKDT
jgi:hypothetical protein